MNQIDLSNINKNENGTYNWQSSIGKMIKFKYYDVLGDIVILDYIGGHCPKLLLKYNDNKIWMQTGCITRCQLSTLVYGNKQSVKKHKEINDRIYTENINNQGCLMKIIDYNSASDIIVEFQDEYKFQKKSEWNKFVKGNIKNPYYPRVFGVGYIGYRYSTREVNGDHTKEYSAWQGILERCFSLKYKEKHPTYQDVTCCDEWLCFENFYEWLHEQDNFDKWFNGNRWAVDKDIIIKGNKIYSPDTCCLVPDYVNTLFIKKDANRGDLPIGVCKDPKRRGYQSMNIYGRNGNKSKTTTYSYPTIEEAFQSYKESKEAYIKKVAQEEYYKGNITKRCYDAMINYQVEITD